MNVDLSNEIDLDSSVHRKILDEIFVLIEMISFCRSSAVKLTKEQAMSEENIVYERCININHRFKDSGFSNVICPMRSFDDMWISFLQHVWQKENATYRWLIDSGLFQAIGNLYFDNINEWMLIKLAAALEGLCEKPSMLKKQECSEIRKAAIESVRLKCSELSIRTEDIEQIIKNINNNSRSLNGYPVKWYIEKTLKDCNLEKFSKNYIEKINDAISMRNKVVHTGWAKEWKTDLFEHIKTLRNTIFLIVLARLEYPGEFYFSGDEHKKPTSLQDWQS